MDEKDINRFFAERDRLLLEGVTNAGLYDIEELAKLAGVADNAVNHALVSIIITFAKVKIMKELERKANDMLFWVERAV